ncbi:MAG: hypothetical protein J7L39_03570 [Candidatus Aenigmarchaeota archaeon]|nr:hypothetical protein [Candidatus Aenigmarchaeota archaeon]
MDFKRVWEWYSREKVQRALIEISKSREVVAVYADLSFGKRPDMLVYPTDILQAVAEGAVSFHGSVERWSQPMKLDVGMTKDRLDELRIGWDIILDPDVNDFQIGKITTLNIIEALKDHGIKNFSVKFTGGKGFHIGIPFESLPPKVNFKETSKLYPELFRIIIEYLKEYIRDKLRDDLLSIENPVGLAQRTRKQISEIISEDGLIDPFKIISLDVFGSRHLFRLPYSLHEKTELVSLPLKPSKIEAFEKENALPENVKVKDRFLDVKYEKRDAEGLIIEAMDWYAIHKKEVKAVHKEVKAKPRVRLRKIPEKYFPPCIKTILKGLADGRKRSIFVLVTFLKNMGWNNEEIEKVINEWNQRNTPPLRQSFIRTQLRWHFRQERNLLPPNCDNPNFLPNYGVCKPDNICKGGTGEIVIKNPINYPFKLILRKKKSK